MDHLSVCLLSSLSLVVFQTLFCWGLIKPSDE